MDFLAGKKAKFGFDALCWGSVFCICVCVYLECYLTCLTCERSVVRRTEKRWFGARAAVLGRVEMIESHLLRFVAPNPCMEPSNILHLLFYLSAGFTRAVTTEGVASNVLQGARNSSALCSVRKLRLDVEYVRNSWVG